MREYFSCKSIFNARRAAYGLRLIHLGRFPDMERIAAVGMTSHRNFALRPIALFRKLLKCRHYCFGEQGRILEKKQWRQLPHSVWIARDEQHIEHISVWRKRFAGLCVGFEIYTRIESVHLKHGTLFRHFDAVPLTIVLVINP